MITSLILAGVLLTFLKQILFAVETLECRALDLLYNLFKSLAGINPVWLNNKETTLLDVFFSNDLISTVYWGMACIGFALTFGFAIAALVRKIFDSTGEKVKATIGQILTNTFKAILLIILMTAIVSATITGTTTLLTAVDDLFNNAEEINSPSTITFDDEDFAVMFKIIDTIGDHAISPAYSNRYNINSCYNEIRNSMQTLRSKRVFEYSYDGAENSWQYALTRLYYAGDIDQDVKLDKYNQEISEAILNIIELIKTNKDSFKPLKSYSRTYTLSNSGQALGRVMMLSCSFGDAESTGEMTEAEAATIGKTDSSKRASFTDPVRRPFYVGDKDIYDYDEVMNTFSYGLTSWNHLINILGVYFLIKEFLIILFNCIARIFNIMVLYITAPGFISVMPLDDGGKFKQWITSFVIQSLSIFGSVVAVRLLMIMIPIILSPNLVIFSNSAADILSKDVVILGMCFTAEKANGLIGGILADNAGYQSILAGEVGSGLAARGLALGGRLASGALGMGFSAGKSILGGLGTASGASTLGKKVSEGVKNMGQSMRDKGGIVGAVKSGWSTDEKDQKKAEQQEKEADKRDTADFRSALLDGMANRGSGQSNSSSFQGSNGGGSQGSNGGVSAKQPPIQNFAPQMGVSSFSESFNVNNHSEQQNIPDPDKL